MKLSPDNWHNPFPGICLFLKTNHVLQSTSPDPLDHISLGEDILLLCTTKATEYLSTLFGYQLELISESRQPIKYEDLLG